MRENIWGYAKRLTFVESLLRERGLRTVLDIGCGNGSQLAIPLVEKGYSVTGIDPDLPSIHRGQSLNSRVHFVHGLLHQLPVQKFDCVILSEVLEHLQEPEALLAQAVEYLSPSGVLIVTVPNGYGEFEFDRRTFQALRLDVLFEGASNFARKLLGRNEPVEVASSEDESPHVQRFTLTRLRRIFEKHGLVPTTQRATSFVSGPLVVYTIRRIPGFVALNARLSDWLPMALSSGWMFALVPKAEPVNDCGVSSD